MSAVSFITPSGKTDAIPRPTCFTMSSTSIPPDSANWSSSIWLLRHWHLTHTAFVKFFTWWLVSGNAFSATKADATFRRSFFSSSADTHLARRTQSMPSTTALFATSEAPRTGSPPSSAAPACDFSVCSVDEHFDGAVRSPMDPQTRGIPPTSLWRAPKLERTEMLKF